MKTSLRFLGFTRMQRIGILCLSLLVFVLQLLSFALDFQEFPAPSAADREWLALQSQIDSLKRAQAFRKPQIYPFNPNFITDYKGYRLGMTTDQIDRLLLFRESGRFVNSAEEFQQVTKVPDSLLARLSPHFKFPEWVNRPKRTVFTPRGKAPNTIKLDINQASQQQLMAVYGIGEGFSSRILKQRQVLGGFVDMSQMRDIWGLPPETAEKLMQQFEVREVPVLNKVNVNQASLKELAAFPYFRYAVAKSVVTYRSMNGPIRSADELVKIANFPVENLRIIRLYLEF